MDNEKRIQNLIVPEGKVDVVLDTDAFNEIDDQYAIAYLLKSKEKLVTKAIYAAPFFNAKSVSPADGMEKSYQEILKMLSIMQESVDVYRGSAAYLENENTPVLSEAARDLAERANAYSPERPLYVVAIGAITNVASAILLNPKVAENTVIVWLGGHAHHFRDTAEFNMRQDVAAARVVMQSGAAFVQLPCQGVVSAFTLSKPEIECWLKGKNPLADYLADITIREMDVRTEVPTWKKVIWDVTAVAWLLNDADRFMESRIVPIRTPGYDNVYEDCDTDHLMQYVYLIKCDKLMHDLIGKIVG